MGLSAHEIELIGALLRHPEGLTVADLADRLGVSARTVHRDLQSASEFLGSRDLTLVRQAGRGVRVEGTTGARDRALEDLHDMDAAAPTPEERRVSLLRKLLVSDEPVKLRALASGVKVSVGTLSICASAISDRGAKSPAAAAAASATRAQGGLVMEGLPSKDLRMSRASGPARRPCRPTA